jgi:hypothetical protein
MRHQIVVLVYFARRYTELRATRVAFWLYYICTHSWQHLYQLPYVLTSFVYSGSGTSTVLGVWWVQVLRCFSHGEFRHVHTIVYQRLGFSSQLYLRARLTELYPSMSTPLTYKYLVATFNFMARGREHNLIFYVRCAKTKSNVRT